MRPPLRVLTITNLWPEPERPWHGIFVARQMRSLPAVGVDVEVLAIAGSASPLRSLPAYLRAAVRALALNFQPRRYDLIHAHTGHCGVLACLQFRYPVVLSYVGYDLDVAASAADRPDTFHSKTARRLFRSLSWVVAATIAQSRRGRSRLPERTKGRNTVIPNGVDREAFAPADRAEARRRLGEAEDTRPWVLFSSDPLRYTKRFELAEAAVEAARREVPNLELKVVAGAAPELMPVWMNAADLMIMSSREEGSPNTVKEAMACDLPIVAVRVGDVAEIINGTRHCHLHPPDPAPAAMGASIVEVVQAIPERSNGRACTDHLGLEAVALRVREVYEQAVERRPGPFGFLRRRRRV